MDKAERLTQRLEELQAKREAKKRLISEHVLSGASVSGELAELTATEQEIALVSNTLTSLEAEKRREEAITTSPEAKQAEKEVQAGLKRAEQITREALDGVLSLHKLQQEYESLLKKCDNLHYKYKLKSERISASPNTKYLGAVYELYRKFSFYLASDDIAQRTELTERYKPLFDISKQ